MSGTSRRDVVKMVLGAGVLASVGCGDGGQGPVGGGGGGGAGVGGGVGAGGGTALNPASAIPSGIVADYPLGSLKGLASWAMYVGRDAGGLYAMSSIFTHLGCDMGSFTAPTGPYCGCHGGQFDANGNVVYGPARSALPHYPVSVDSATGAVTVDGTQVVAQSARVAF